MENVLYIITITSLIFFTGILGLLTNRRNLLITIMTLELLLLSVNLNFITFSIYLDDIVGQIFVLFILTIAASESSIGLSIITKHFKLVNVINYEKIKFI